MLAQDPHNHPIAEAQGLAPRLEAAPAELAARRVWAGCCALIASRLDQQAYQAWFAPIRAVSLIDGVLHLGLPNSFFYEYIEEHYVDLLREALDQELGPEGRLEYSVATSVQALPVPVDRLGPVAGPVQPIDRRQLSKSTATVSAPPGTTLQALQTPFAHSQLGREVIRESYLNPQYTFDNYVVGDCNSLVCSVGRAIADRPGLTSFNPVTIFGGVGLGKTHLMQAIGNQVKLQHPDKFVLYVTQSNFTNQFIHSVKTNSVHEFNQFYAQVDVLLIDDIQFLAEKDKTQDIFFHLFNHLLQSRKQIVMTSDASPRDMKGIQERLLSRFRSGLSDEIKQPDYEMRVAIIQKKLEQEQVQLPDDVTEFIARNVDTNVRELEGALISIVAQSSLNRRTLDLDLARQILRNLVKETERELSPESIQRTISDYFNIPISDMKSPKRKREIVVARQVAMHFIRQHTTLSLSAIGGLFGGRDHTTVMHALQAVSEQTQIDRKFKSTMLHLSGKFAPKPPPID